MATMDRSKVEKPLRKSRIGRTLLMTAAVPVLAVTSVASIGAWGLVGRVVDSVQRMIVPTDSPKRQGQWYWWVPANESALEARESSLYKAHVKTDYEMTKVAGLGTVHVPYSGDQERTTPVKKLVLVHGFGGGNGLWTLNLHELSKHYDVYAVEWIGAGRSDRPKFTAKTFEEADKFFVDPIEQWRGQMGIDEFVLVGHSMGAMLGTSYAEQYPSRVQQLILASPAGVPDRPKEPKEPSIMIKALRRLWLCGVSPMSIARFTGPFGPNVINWIIEKRFSMASPDNVFRSGLLSVEDAAEYVYHNWAMPACAEHILNSHLYPGVIAKRSLTETMVPGEWNIPTSFIYGAPNQDWMDMSHGVKLAESLKGSVHVDVRSIPNAGHQLFLDNPKGFNKAVIGAISDFENKGSTTNRDILKDINFV